MKTIGIMIIALFLTSNFALAQDTLYIYKAGAVLYKQVISNIDSVTFEKSNPFIETVTDIDSNVYETVTIGKQIWMVENLKVTRYQNGDTIPMITNDTWWNLDTGALCNYDNDTSMGSKYGKLYNWYAVNDVRKIAPIGWHVPSEKEWTELENFVGANLGISSSIAKALASKTEWALDNHGGVIGNDLTKNNTYGFTALPSGYRHNGTFMNIGNGGCWWSSDEYDLSNAWRRYLGYSYNNLGSYTFIKVDGFSVRCIKD